MGRGLAGDVDAAGLGLADELDTLPAGDMADMVAAARLGGKLQVPGDGAPFALAANALVPMSLGVSAVVNIAAVEQAVVLAVGGDELAQVLGPQHRLPHHRPVLHATAVV